MDKIQVKYIYLLLCSILIAGCSGGNYAPIQVSGELSLGEYVVTPPAKYWYFPREYPSNSHDSSDPFILSFHENKKSLTGKSPDENGLIFTISIANNKYISDNDYYNESKKWSEYSELPENVSKLSIINNWSCKQVVAGMHGIECISLREHFVTIAEFGYEHDDVLGNIDLLYKILLSFKEKNNESK